MNPCSLKERKEFSMQTRLSKLKKGKSGIIVKIDIEEENKKRHILDIGLTKNTRIKVKKIAPSGDPISLELRDYELCMSKSDLEKIIVEI